MIRKSLIQLIHEAASIKRWNDHIRPDKGFAELDKQSHRMMFTYVLAKYEEDSNVDINWRILIEGGIFEFLHRIVLTDIKPPAFHKLMQHKGEQLNTWVLEQLQHKIEDISGGFFDRFRRYLFDSSYAALEKRILKASHYLATHWEFKIIYNMNSTLYGLQETKIEIESQVNDHHDLKGVKALVLKEPISNFLDLIGQLRFQQRWSRSPRVPETSVMGHMLVVAILSYLCSTEIGACDERIKNNFFAGLFHDLPEVLTRDIISPVKKSVEGLEELIKEMEKKQVEEIIFPMIPIGWHDELKYYIEDEFKSKIIQDRVISFVSSEKINERYNRKGYAPVDGELIRVCDHLSAYIEAYLSISYGIQSQHLLDGHKAIYDLYENRKIANIDFGQLFDYFKI